MKRILEINKPVFILFGCFIALGAFLLFITTKSELHLFFNSFVRQEFNTFFKYVTNLGDGLFVVFVLLLLFFINIRFFLATSLAYVCASLITQLLKLTVYDSIVRPTVYFAGKANLQLVKGVDTLANNSFPSGHSTAAFSLFFSLAFISKKKWIKVICFFIAFFVALSRVYLSQHFFEDVYVGSIIGTLFSSLFFYVFYLASFSKSFDKLDKSLLKNIFSSNKNV